MTPADRPLGWAPAVALLVGAAGAAAAAVRLAPAGQSVATFWPAAGLGLVAVVLSPRARWKVLVPLLAVAIAVGDLVVGRGVRIAVPHGVVEGLALLLAALVLTYGGRRQPALEEQEQFVRLLASAAVVGGAVALGGAVVSRVVDFDPVLPPLAATFAAHAASVLVLVPLAVVRAQRWAGNRAELVLQVLLLAGASALTFVPGASATLTFAPVLFLAWAALRFDLRVACAQLALFSVFVTAQTALGTGPFGDGIEADAFTALTGGALTQGYLGFAALLVLPLGIAIQRNTLLLERITTDGRLFRRNFTESLLGMAFLEPDETGADLVIVDLNDTALDILGRTEESLLGLRISEVLDVGPEYAAALPRLVDGSLEGWRVEGALRSRAGRVTLQLSALGGDSDEATFFAAQLLDTTAEHDARHGLEAAQTLTNATLDTTNCIIMVTDTDGIVVRVNQATSAITGYREDELLGRKVWDTGITPADAADVEALFTWQDRSGAPIVRESDALTRSGEKLRIVWNTNIVRDDRGEAMYAVMTGIDVTAERTTAGLVNHLMEASLTTAIIGVDTAGRISVANSGLQHLLGYERGELVGEPFHKLLKPHELLERTGADTLDGAFDVLVRGLGRDGETRARDWTWVAKGGGEQLVSMTLSVAQDAFAAQTGYLCVARDVTEQRHSQEMLIAALDKERTAVERLRSLDQAKNEFVSTVSHELRTPVTSIVGYTEMMSDGSIVEPLPEQLPLLETINRNGQRLIAMINDLLMLSGLDSDSVAWRHDPVDLAATVGPIEDAIRPLLHGRHLTLETDRPTGMVPVLGDRAQLERVMINLLSNAVKFTEDGGTVAFTVGTDGDDAVITVRDTGIGIPAAEQAELFQRFFRSSTAQVRQIQGTGLGLSIVAAIVSGHGGTIEVESEHMQGSTFTVRLPLAPSERLTRAV
ncbi:PAS domain S-box protein [Nocardioides anomalus]|uniref:histidine kinase n=1 Tax=Nocardioides anomalus TaxID=2712223 RepID=A0A6G6WBM8_9ACTN|nr:PAS domain S-box protein [Nocardioides anomalus]QIG42751.1 PAS domain S-box protein [Nocardioides anomalus]